VEPDGRPIAGRVAVTRERWQVADKESPATRRTQDAGRCWEPAPASHHPWNHHRLSLQYGPARTRVCWQIWSRTHALCRERDRHTYVRMLEGETQHLQLSLSLSSTYLSRGQQLAPCTSNNPLRKRHHPIDPLWPSRQITKLKSASGVVANRSWTGQERKVVRLVGRSGMRMYVGIPCFNLAAAMYGRFS
jgi:hypothetical protein